MNLLELVQRSAEANPDVLAVTAPDGTRTYRELMIRAAALAEAYAAHGVGPGDRVGGVLAPGVDTVAAWLAAFARRAAYVPVDPAQPPRRAVGSLRRCGVALCLGVPSPGWEEMDLRTPDDLAGPWPAASGPGDMPCLPPGTDDDVAYVIHTSGSTGVPKGIQVQHGSVHNLLRDLDDRVPVTGPVTGSWWCSPDFDVSVWEMWSALCSGGTLAIPAPADRAEAARFTAFLDRAAVTSAYVPHGYLPELRDRFASRPDSGRHLQRLVVGIEPIALGLLQDLMELRPGVTVINGYGPAEATVLSTLYLVPRAGGDPGSRTPIGTAVRGNTLHLLDEDGKPTEADEGELVITGANVARGYLNGSPDQLARFTDTPQGRSYRTGDRVRRLPDGNHLFLGRIDFQMKVRGYRIEPGEVETAIRSLGTVREVVVGHRDIPGIGDAVVAYVVPDDEETFDHHRARAALRGVLPSYALPSAFIVLREIPVLAKNGKVDRTALAAMPVPEPARREESPDATGAAGDDTTGLVLRAWQRELGDGIPGDLGFIDLGGASLPAVRVAHTLRESTGRAVTVADVLAAESAAGLAASIDLAPPASAGEGPPAEGSQSGPLSPNQLGMWLNDAVNGGNSYPLSHCFVLPGEYDLERLAAALTRAISAHPVFGAATEQQADGVRLSLARHRIGLSVVDISAGSGADAPRDAVLRQAAEPFTLQGGALMRTVVVRHPGGSDLLLLSWHHLVVDGWSVRMFLEDLQRCYDDPGHAPASQRMTACDINAWLDEQSRSPELTRRVEQAAEAIALVPDVPSRHPGLEAEAALRPLDLDPGLWNSIRETGRRSRLLPYSFLCTAYQYAVIRHLGVERFVLGCVVAGRDRPDLRRIAGWYVNTELVASAATGAPPDLTTVQTVETELRKAHEESGELPVALIASRLRAKDRKAPQIIFSLDEEYTLRLGGAACEKVPLRSPRRILAANLVLLTGPGRIAGYFEHGLSLLSVREADALLETFEQALRVLTERG